MDNSLIGTAKDIANVISPLTSAIIETWLKPKLKLFFESHETNEALFKHGLANKFEEYLQHAYEKHFYVNVLVFPNQQTRLEDIFIPLTVNSAKYKHTILVDGYKDEFIPFYRKVLITDYAGVGKSTLLKYLFLSAVKGNYGIPIFIELRSLTKENSILNYIYNELTLINEETDKEFILELIRRGDFIFFFDGYDEIPFADRSEVVRSLQEFTQKAANNYFILTSRPELSLAAFADFQLFHIQPLATYEAYTLLRKYDRAEPIAERLIAKLEEEEYSNLTEFLSNPLLISLLYKAYEYKQTIPLKKHIFYRQVYDALYESHDLTKGGAFIHEKHSQLDMDDFHKVLRYLGFVTVKLGQVEFDKDKLLSLITGARSYFPSLSFKEADFLKDIVTTVPLFIRDGDFYRWAHKSIQEYFAAQFIFLDSKSEQRDVLKAMSQSNKVLSYFNVLDLYFDIDYKSFRQAIISELINDFLDFYRSAYNNIDRNLISEDQVHRRKIASYGFRAVLVPASFINAAFDKREYRQHSIEDLVLDVGYQLGDLKNYDGEVIIHSFNLPFREYYLVIKDYAQRSLLRLLRSKGESFVSLEPELDHLLNLRTKHLDFEEPFTIDDNPNSVGNHQMFFDSITEMLLAAIPKNIFDVEKCRILQEQINKEIEKENRGGFLTNDI